MKVLIRSFVTVSILLALVVLVREGYDHSWTGFAANELRSNVAPAKTLWDWLDLLIVPILLATGAFFWEDSRKRTEREVEGDRQMQKTLDDYLASISELLLERHLSTTSQPNLAREVARTRTLTALRQLDGKRKSQVLQFLYEAGLIGLNPVIQLNGADFRGALLDEATLSRAELRGVYFSGASLRNATLIGTDFQGSDFSEVDFHRSNLSNARLAQATLHGADLRTAKLKNVDLSEVDLGRVKLTNEQRIQLKSEEDLKRD